MRREGQSVADDRRVDGRHPGQALDRQGGVIGPVHGPVGGVEEGRSGGDGGGHARREVGRGQSAGRVRRRALGLPAQGVGPGQVDDPALVGPRGDDPDLVAVGRRYGDPTELHGYNSFIYSKRFVSYGRLFPLSILR